MKLILKKFVCVLIIACSLASCNYYDYIFNSNVKETTLIFIPENATYNDVLEIIEPHLKNIEGFKWVAERKKYPKLVKPGRYLLKKGESNNVIVNKLRIGNQEPVKLKLGYEIQTLEQLAKALNKNLDIPTNEFIDALSKKDYIIESGLKGNEQLVFFIPDTYEFYWNTSPDKFLDKMKNEYDNFWTSENREKAKDLGLTLLQTNVLTTIVQEESSKKDEQPKIARLYLNRLKNNIKLQADPTVKYAVKQKNGFSTSVKRIYYKDLFLDSPYNTYKVTGLPPAPIGLATKQALNATLNATKHEYIYMCADPKNAGYHVFEKTYEAHELNAQKYREWANKTGLN